MDAAHQFATFILTLLSVSGIVFGFVASVIKKYRAPFEHMEQRINDLESKRTTCEKHFAADKESIDQLRAGANTERKRVDDAYEILSAHEEGLHLCIQHEVKGNHIELLEDWQRRNAAANVARKGEHHGF